MMPVFNATAFLEASLRSVLAQTFRSFEIIVYDDGSTDGTSDVIRARFTDERIRLYRSARNRGVVHARNRILRLARGEYLVPHDHDDVMCPGRLTVQARCLDRHPDIGVVLGTFRVTGRDTYGRPRKMIPWAATGAGRRRLRGAAAPGTLPLGVHHGAAMIRRTVLARAGGYDRRWEGIEDFDLLVRLAERTRFYFLDHVAFVYQRRPGSLTERLRSRSEAMGSLLSRSDRRARVVVGPSGSEAEITADRARPLSVIREGLGVETSPPSGKRAPELAVELRSSRRPRHWADLGLDSQALAQLRLRGVTHRVDRMNRLATVVLDPTRRLTDDIVYHAAFLHPFSHVLHEAGATLAHAALLARGGWGVLIMGESGSGKSTLSLALIRRGYAYFSDEHPVMALEGDTIIGRGFGNRIGVSARSLRHFPGLRAAAVWSERRRKWYLMSEAVRPDCVGRSCRIETVLFPRFRPTARLRVRRLRPLAFLRRLQQDEYYVMLAGLADGARAARDTHLRLLLKLVRSAPAYAVTYGVGDLWRLTDWLETLRGTTAIDRRLSHHRPAAAVASG
jgi:GT2 family glycosyltransferase